MKKLILKTFARAIKHDWNTLYWAVDIHDTTLEATYDKDVLPTKFFPLAKEVLQRISKRKDSVLIMFTCSHAPEIEQYLKFFKENEINFKYVNENPEVCNIPGLGCFDKKWYFNFLLEDKAFFQPERDWPEIKEALDEVDILYSQGLKSKIKS